jgi:signal-transduction protein with cAMP-binding, CBS, and nucleotidyltransferase domain
MKTGIKVVDAMTRTPIKVGPNETLLNCAQKMMVGDVGSLIIEENGVLLGILTEKDIVNKVVSKNLDIETTPVKKVMSTTMIKISPDLDLYDAIYFMSREGVRRLPVTDGDKLIGLLTYKDVLKIQPDLYDIFIEKFKLRR